MPELTLPEYLVVNGAEIPICADFRTVLRIFEVFDSAELSQNEKIIAFVDLLYEAPIPADQYAEAATQGIWFLNGGEPERSRRSRDFGKLYSWTQDRLYIFSAVDSVLGYSSRGSGFLHWWDFLGAFMAIGDCAISNAISMRKKKKKGKLTKEEKTLWNESVDFYELRSSSQDEADALLAYLQGR